MGLFGPFVGRVLLGAAAAACLGFGATSLVQAEQPGNSVQTADAAPILARDLPNYEYYARFAPKFDGSDVPDAYRTQWDQMMLGEGGAADPHIDVL